MAGWALKASMPVAVAYPILTAQASSGKIFALAGKTSVGYGDTTAHRSYDPVTNTWTTLAAYPVANRAGMNYVNAGASNFVFGSYQPGSGIFSDPAILTAYQYSISANTWTAKATNPGGARVGGDCVWNGADYIYWVGGQTGSASGRYSDTLRYSISGNSWATLASLPNPNGNFYYGALAFLSGTLVHGYQGADYAGLPTWMIIDVATGTLTNYPNGLGPEYAQKPISTNYSDPYPMTSYYVTPVADPHNGYIWYVADSNESNRIVAVRQLTSPYNMTYTGRRSPQPASSVTERSAILTGGYLYSGGGTSNPDTSARTGRLDQYQLSFPNAPTTVAPAAGATVNNDLPTLSATFTSNGEVVRPEWQIARDAGFTVSLRTIAADTGEKDIWGINYIGRWITSGTVTQKLRPGSQELFQGTWYIRCRGRNEPDATPWSATQSFTVSHPPSVSLSSPVNGVALLYGANGDVKFQWNFSDTSETDYQTAYQLIVERSDTGAVLLDTGKQVSQTARSYNWSLPAANKDYTIRWKMRAWDSDDVAGSYSPYATFSMSDAPVVNITSPAEGAQIDNGTPTTTWTFTASGGRVQAKYRVRFYGKENNTLLYDTGVLQGSSKSFTPSDQVVGVGLFYARVDAWDAGGLTGYDTNNFSTSYDAPLEPGFLANASTYETEGYIAVAWTNAEQDHAWKVYRVYRRLAGAADWKMVYETSAVQTEYEYHDYSPGSGVSYEYVVVQAADRFGQNVESFKTNPQAVTGHSDQYWLVDAEDSSNNFLLPNVTGDDFTDEWEEETLNVIGRGRHKDYGTRFGYSGGLSAKFNGPYARSTRLALEGLKLRRAMMLLRNPFGDVWQVAMGNVSVKRVAGTGTYESVEVQIPYEEVS